MVKLYTGIETKPSLVVLNQIEVSQESSGTSKYIIDKVSENLKKWQFNLALPIVCITDQEDKYRLLTGLPIYEAAVAADLARIWVFVIAARQPEAEKAIEPVVLQSKLNERVVDPEDILEFLKFLDDVKSPLTLIRGIGDKYALKIAAKRPYKSPEDMKKLGTKQPLAWLKAYKEWKNSI
ncbi:MAG: hypothetical protein WBB28_22845 [Crinalium sp.]